MRIPDGELSSRVVRQLLNLGGEEGVDHKHQRFRVPTYGEKKCFLNCLILISVIWFYLLSGRTSGLPKSNSSSPVFLNSSHSNLKKRQSNAASDGDKTTKLVKDMGFCP